MIRLSHLFTVTAITAITALVAPANATPYPMQYNFVGEIVQGPPAWQGYSFHGYFRYDAGTAPTSPGVWDLRTASIHIEFPSIIPEFPSLTFDTSGQISAQVSPTAEAITFEAIVNPIELPFPNDYGGTLDIRFETYRDNSFSLWHLPTSVPPGDKSLVLDVPPGGGDSFFVGTDSAFGVSLVPEPATAAVFLVGLMGLGWGVRRRFNAKTSARTSIGCAG